MVSLGRIAAVLDFKMSGIARGNTLHQQLKNRRIRLALSIDDLSQITRLAPATISNIERGTGHVQSAEIVLQSLAPAARLREPPRAHWSPGSPDNRLTPLTFMDAIRSSFGPIGVDPCAHENSFVHPRRAIYEAECGLKTSWEGHDLAFVNPPFSALVPWMERSYRAWSQGEVKTVLGLFPARWDSETYHRRIFGIADILQLRHRLRFYNPDGTRGHQAPFSIMIVAWGADKSSVNRFRELVECGHIPPTGSVRPATP